jgi:TetR/AcrR family transcriptional regulator, cholesterol catabolism regulator
MPPVAGSAGRPSQAAGSRRQPRLSKRELVIETAIRQFAHYGYDSAKWADVAEQVGLGQTALYHYFASKAHCLFTIMADTLREHRDQFEQVQREHSDPIVVITEAIKYTYQLDEVGVLRNRVLQAEIGFLNTDYDGGRQERASLTEARGYARDLTRDWARFLEGAMRQGAIPAQNPRILAHSILGLTSDVFHWYRPTSTLSLKEIGDAVEAHVLAIVLHTPGLRPADAGTFTGSAWSDDG